MSCPLDLARGMLPQMICHFYSSSGSLFITILHEIGSEQLSNLPRMKLRNDETTIQLQISLMPKPVCLPQYRLPPRVWMNILRRVELKLELHTGEKGTRGGGRLHLPCVSWVSGYVDVCSLGSLRRKRDYLHLGGRGCSGHGAELLRWSLMGLVFIPVWVGISAGTNHDRWLYLLKRQL